MAIFEIRVGTRSLEIMQQWCQKDREHVYFLNSTQDMDKIKRQGTHNMDISFYYDKKHL